MSTIQPSHELVEIQGRDEPGNVYRRYIFEDPAICSECHRRMRNGPRRTLWASVGHDKEAKDPIPEYAQRDGREAYGEVAIYPMATICEDCGSVEGRADDYTLSKREAIDRCEPMATRLEEIGEPVDVDVLKRAVGKLKSDPRLEAFDTEIFERATKIAVRRARQSR